jgi:hypothetical protein
MTTTTSQLLNVHLWTTDRDLLLELVEQARHHCTDHARFDHLNHLRLLLALAEYNSPETEP